MDSECTENLNTDTHEAHELHVEVAGESYTFMYHESIEPTNDLVVLLPGLTDNSIDNVAGIVMQMPDFPVNFITLQYCAPFSLEAYSEVLFRAVSMTRAQRVVCEGYCLGGAVLARFLADYSERNSDEFEITAAIFRSAIIDRSSFQSRVFEFLHGAQEDLPMIERILSKAFPTAARLYPRAELSGQAAAGLIDGQLVVDELSAIPRKAEVTIPPGVRICYIGLDRDRVADNDRNIEMLSLSDGPLDYFILRSSTERTTHHPEDVEELYRTQAERIREWLE